MSIGSIVILVLACICLVIGLMLSGSGSTTGLSALSGQDLELFKKTKDRGIVKILQAIMFFVTIALLVLLVLFNIFNI